MSKRKWPGFSAVIALCAGMGMSCGGSKTPTNQDANSKLATSTESKPVEPRLPPLPAKLEHLTEFVPNDAPLVVHLPGEGLFTPDSEGKPPFMSAQDLAPGLSDAWGIPASLIAEFLMAIDEAAYFANPDECIAVRLRTDRHVDSLLEQLSLRRMPGGRLESTGANQSWNGAWLNASQTLILCASSTTFENALRAARGEAPSFATSKHAGLENEAWAFVDLHKLTQGSQPLLSEGSKIIARLPRWSAANIDVHFMGRGPGYPQLAEVIGPVRHDALAQLPQGAVMALSLSLKRADGKTFDDIVGELDRVAGAGLVNQWHNALSNFGIDAAKIDQAIGNELAIGVYMNPKFTSLKLKSGAGLPIGAVVAIPTANDAVAKSTWQTLLRSLEKNKTNKNVIVTPDSVTTELVQGIPMRFTHKPGFLLAGIGEKEVSADLMNKFASAKQSFGALPEFEASRKKHPPAYMMQYFDSMQFLRLNAVPVDATFFGPTPKSEFITITFGSAEHGLDVGLQGSPNLFASVMGTGAYAIKRYQRSAMTADVKNIMGRISRAVAAAYERENEAGEHHLCGSAIAVPSFVPAGRTYLPQAEEGHDFHTGDARTGWRCLKVEVTSSTRYQYEYRAGGPHYKGPTRGGPDPGPNGFEISAEGDLNGDGKTSLFTAVGEIRDNKFMRATQIFIVDEFE